MSIESPTTEELDAEPETPERTPNASRDRARRMRASARPRSFWWEWSAVLLSPAALFLVLRPEEFFTQNGVDPFLYLGYSWDTRDLIDRFGMEYYPVRWGLTLPIYATTKLFGTVGGFYVMRYALALVAIVPLYAYLRRRSAAIGALGVLLFLSSPMLLRGLMTAYSDTTGVPYLTGAIALLLTTQVTDTWRRTRLVAAGALLGLAVNSNPIIVALAMAIVGGWGIWELSTRRWRIVVDGALVLAGIVGVSLFGVLYFWYRFDQPDIFTPSIDAARHWSGAAGESFRAPDYGWLSYRFFLYLPPLVLVAWLLTLPRGERPRRDGWAAMTVLAAMSAFFVVHQFVLGSTSMETYYYTSYLTPAIVIGLALVVDRVLAPLASVWWRWSAVAVAFAFLLIRNAALETYEFSWNPGLVLVLGVTLVAVGLVWRLPRVAPVAMATLVLANGSLLFFAPSNPPLSPGQTFRYDPHYELALGNAESTGLSWYEMSHELVDVMPPLTGKDGNLLFWYDTSNQLLTSLQSTYRSLPIAWQANLPPMPNINDAQMQRLRDDRTGWLVLLGTSEAELRAGVDALVARGVEIPYARTRTLSAPGYEVKVEVLRIVAPSAPS